MDYTTLRNYSLKAFVGFLALTAIFAIISVLIGEFGPIQQKILLTTFSISAASILSMACAAFIEKRKNVRLGLAGILLSAAAAILVIVGIWMDIKSDEYWKTTGTFIVAALAFAHAFLLILPDLDTRHKWVQRAAAVSIGILAVQIASMVWEYFNSDVYVRILSIMAIVVGLETLVIPMMMKLRKGAGSRTETLILEKIEGNIYRASDGKEYLVTAAKRADDRSQVDH